jgi:hypothetical protein
MKAVYRCRLPAAREGQMLITDMVDFDVVKWNLVTYAPPHSKQSAAKTRSGTHQNN